MLSTSEHRRRRWLFSHTPPKSPFSLRLTIQAASPDVQYLRQHTRPCPQCSVRTQRAAGCMHITCTNCGVEWCWACGQYGKGIHHAFACSNTPDPTWQRVRASESSSRRSRSHSRAWPWPCRLHTGASAAA